MTAKSIKGNTPEEIQSALVKSMEDGYQPTLACVFLSRMDDADAVTGIMDSQNMAVFGASTSQKFSEQGIDEDGIVVLLMDMKPANFNIILKDFRSAASAYEAASEVGEAGKKSFDRPAFIISTADITISSELVIRGLLDKGGKDATVIGGGAGEHANFQGIVFTNHSKSNCGMISLILDEDNVDVKGVAISGWKPIGTEKKITRSESNWVYMIDNEPALDVVQKFLGREIELSDVEVFPLQVQRTEGKPMMRPILLWNKENRSIMLGGPVEEGASFRFSLPPDPEVIDTVIKSATTIKEKELPDADAMLIFSCMGRLTSLGPMVSMELDGLAATWNKPLAGFFCLGEYGKLDNTRPEFHGKTVSWVALKEK
jgi:hypothetical protein